MLYLASTVHPAHAHKMRAHRWADDPAAQEAMRAKVPRNMAEAMAYLEGRMDGDWIADRFSAADLHLWNVTRWVDGDGVPLAGFARLAAHHARVLARPAVARIAALHGAR